jgi:hypothetical protein
MTIVFSSAFALDLFGFDMYTFSPEAAGVIFFLDPFEGTETSQVFNLIASIAEGQVLHGLAFC